MGLSKPLARYLLLETKHMKILSSLVGACLSAALLAACGGFTSQSSPSNAVPSHQTSRVAPDRLSGPTLYVRNAGQGKAASVSVYAAGGASFLRNIKLAGPFGSSIAVGDVGHLLASGSSTDNGGILNIYSSRGSRLVQSLDQRHLFGLLTLDRSNNLFTLCAADRLCEYAHDNQQILKPRAIRKIALAKLGAVAFALAVDGSGNLAVSSETAGVLVFAPGKTEPYWRISGSGLFFGALAFDSSNNLFVTANDSVAVYAPGGTSPIRTITSGLGTYPQALAFDGSGNLYVLSYCLNRCGQPPAIAVYAPDGETPIRTITQGLINGNAQVLAVDRAGNLYVGNSGGIPSDPGNVVVYAPGGSIPTKTITEGVQNPFQLATGP